MNLLPRYSDIIRFTRVKVLVLVVITALTVTIHYGWLTDALFGHVHWLHALHSRFCYIPIAIAASWFGLRGGVISAAAISLLVLPYLLGATSDVADLTQELVEIFFYFAIGILVGALIDREMLVRRKHAETKLQLERSRHLSLVGQMAAGVAHEIKNPLASIKGALEIIRDENVPKSDRDEFSDIASKEVKRIDGTVAEFLQFARPRESEKHDIDLSALVESTLKQLNPQVAKAALELKSDVQPGIHVRADWEQLHQALLNLVLNAMEASQPSGTLRIELKRSNRGRIVLSVSDTGSGMTEAQQAQAFDPFYTTKTAGTGLGLAIVQSIVDGHDGEIEIASAPGKGTQVDVVLPAIGGVID